MSAAPPDNPSRSKGGGKGYEHQIEAAKKAWNEWLDERDRAPGEVIAEWAKKKTLEGLEAAKGYAQAGLEFARAPRSEETQLDAQGEPVRKAWNEWLDERERAPGEVITQWVKQKTAEGLEAARELAPVGCDVQKLRAVTGGGRQALGQGTERGGLTTPCAPCEDCDDLLPSCRAGSGGAPGPGYGGGVPTAGARPKGFEDLLAELFRLHDLNGNGSIEEAELIKLNEKIAMLHYGKGADKGAVREKFSGVFRANLDPDGKPVGFHAFRTHTLKTLNALDTNAMAQEMILEQFIAEAQSARAAFHCPSFASATDAEFLPHLQGDRPEEATLLAPILEASHSKSREDVEEASPLPAKPAPAGSGEAAPMSMADRVALVHGEEAATSSRPAVPVAHRVSERSVSEGHQGDSMLRQHLVSHRSMSAGDPPLASAGAAKSIAELAHEIAMSSAAFGRDFSTATEDAGPASNPDDSAPGSQLDEQLEAQRKATGGFAKGDELQVWSNSKAVWLDGVVLDAFAVDCEAEGYAVPAGTLKVSSAAGVKWIRPGQANASLRRK